MVENGCLELVVREYDVEQDCKQVVELERRCEVGPSAKLSLFTDLLGDPLCRIRNSPSFLMLVRSLSLSVLFNLSLVLFNIHLLHTCILKHTMMYYR